MSATEAGGVVLLPRIPASAGALVWDRKGRLLILKPTYKSGWTIPGGIVEADGETPWEACRRETREECGLDLRRGELVCVDFLRPRPGRPGGMRFLFNCGTFDRATLAGIVVQEEEISEYRLARIDRALRLFSGPIRRRVAAATSKPGRLHYLEDGAGSASRDGASGRQLNLRIGGVVQRELELSHRDRHGGLAERDLADVQRPVELLHDIATV